jgi:hypothetical protein
MSRDKPVLRAIKLLTLMGAPSERLARGRYGGTARRAAESLKAYGVGRRLKSASG